MIKAIVLDCGGVMVAPVTGDWILPPSFQAILGEDFIAERLDDFRRVRSAYVHLLPDSHKIKSDAQEYQLTTAYYGQIFSAMDMQVSKEKIEELSYIQTYSNDRYTFFPDVLAYLEKWKASYKLGIVSDAPPSTKRILSLHGVMDMIDAATFSCDIGVLKPNPPIYTATLAKLNLLPEEALFVDDLPANLRGAQEAGMPGVQMRREMPAYFEMPAQWDGDVVHNFAELDQYIQMLSIYLK